MLGRTARGSLRVEGVRPIGGARGALMSMNWLEFNSLRPAATLHEASALGGSGPYREARGPQWARLAFVGVTALSAAAACANSDDNQVLEPVVVALTSDMAPAVADDQVSIYQVAVPIVLPMRRATREERQALGRQDPYPREPFHKLGDTEITVRYTISNLDDQSHAVEVLFDPYNEFVRYQPGYSMSEEETIPDFSGYDKWFIVPPKSRVEGTLTTFDANELAIDLATAQNLDRNPPANPPVELNALYNRAFNLQNRSSDEDPVVGPFIPPVIANLTGFDLGLRTYEPANLAVEAIVDVIDLHGDRTLPRDSPDRPINRPNDVLTPPAAAP